MFRNSIAVNFIDWRKPEIRGENYRPVASPWQTLLQNVSFYEMESNFTLQWWLILIANLDTPMPVPTSTFSFGHCVACTSSIYGFWLLLWYLVAIVLPVLLRFTDSDYSFGILDLRILITPLVSSNLSSTYIINIFCKFVIVMNKGEILLIWR
jgi:hypothetical protein